MTERPVPVKPAADLDGAGLGFGLRSLATACSGISPASYEEPL
jgi:hypothetical protein